MHRSHLQLADEPDPGALLPEFPPPVPAALLRADAITRQLATATGEHLPIERSLTVEALLDDHRQS